MAAPWAIRPRWKLYQAALYTFAFFFFRLLSSKNERCEIGQLQEPLYYRGQNVNIWR
jgi:hypothetical protein